MSDVKKIGDSTLRKENILGGRIPELCRNCVGYQGVSSPGAFHAL
jgi:hypothetical protein